jgi:hypothetical protein
MLENCSPDHGKIFGDSSRGIAQRCVRRISFAIVLLLASSPAIRPIRAAVPPAQERKEKPEKSERQRPSSGEPKAAKSESPESAADEKSPVSLSGQVAENSAGPHGVIRFWLTVENRSGQPIGNLQLTQPQIPGFRLTRLCWPAAKDSQCPEISSEIATKDSDANSNSAAVPSGSLIDLHSSLTARESVTVWGYLEAAKASPKQIAFLTVSWDGPGHSSKTIGLGEVESLSAPRAFFLFFSNNWEWTFPILLPILGFLGSLLLKRWARKRKARAEELSYAQRTWSLMLKQAQTIGLKYYTPLSGCLQTLRDELEMYSSARTAAAKDSKAPQDTDSVLTEACYDVLMLQRRLRETLDVVGGYYFKNRDAEFLADALYQKHKALLDFSPQLREKFSAASLEMKVTTTWAEFLVQVGTPRNAVHGFWPEFRAHMAKISEKVLEEELRVLDAYSALLNYEVNYPMLYWYGIQRPIQFKFTTGKKSRDEILNWGPYQAKLHLSDSQVVEYERAGKNYLTVAEKEVRAGPEKKKWWHFW